MWHLQESALEGGVKTENYYDNKQSGTDSDRRSVCTHLPTTHDCNVDNFQHRDVAEDRVFME